MKVVYKGHEIEVTKSKCLAGYPGMAYSIFRVSDGYECANGFTEDASTVREYIGYMKERVDAELADADPWGQQATKYPLGYMQQRGAA